MTKDELLLLQQLLSKLRKVRFPIDHDVFRTQMQAFNSLRDVDYIVKMAIELADELQDQR